MSTTRTYRPAIALLGLALLLSACQGAPPPRAEPVSPAAAWCRDSLAELDAMIEYLGVGYAENRRIDGFPYLRVTRPLQALRHELRSRAQFETWVDALAAQDALAREAELTILAQRVPELPPAPQLMARVDQCRQVLREQELRAPARQAQLMQAAEVADDYSLLARTLGLYPLTRFALQIGVAGYQREVRELFRAPLPPTDTGLVYAAGRFDTVPAEQVSRWIEAAADNPLKIPQFSAAQWRALAETYAPTLWLDGDDAADRIGSPRWHTDAPGIRVDTRDASVFYRTGFAEFGRRHLPQLTYVAWFPERPKSAPIDPYAGHLDGLIWRVTLGVDGRPLAYDTIHPCGCFHMFFTPRKLGLRAPDGGRDPVLVPQTHVPDGPLALRIHRTDHMLQRLLPAERVRGREQRRYRLRDWQDLNLLPDGRGGLASLYDADAMVPGTQRLERFYLWPSGVRSPGQMRAWGHHATAFVGRRHFDDPGLLCEVIACP